MKKAVLLIIFFALFSCKSAPEKNPLVIPPNFNELPDLNNLEKPSKKQEREDVEKLKELLLKSD